jgi:hypothetical protein
MDLTFKGSTLILSLETMKPRRHLIQQRKYTYGGSNVCGKTDIEEKWLIGDQCGLVDETSEWVSHRGRVQQYV